MRLRRGEQSAASESGAEAVLEEDCDELVDGQGLS